MTPILARRTWFQLMLVLAPACTSMTAGVGLQLPSANALLQFSQSVRVSSSAKTPEDDLQHLLDDLGYESVVQTTTVMPGGQAANSSGVNGTMADTNASESNGTVVDATNKIGIPVHENVSTDTGGFKKEGVSVKTGNQATNSSEMSGTVTEANASETSGSVEDGDNKAAPLGHANVSTGTRGSKKKGLSNKSSDDDETAAQDVFENDTGSTAHSEGGAETSRSDGAVESDQPASDPSTESDQPDAAVDADAVLNSSAGNDTVTTSSSGSSAEVAHSNAADSAAAAAADTSQATGSDESGGDVDDASSSGASRSWWARMLPWP